MDSTVTAYRTFDKQEIMQVVFDPAIIKTIKEDNGDADINPEQSCFIACKVNDELAAVWIFERVGAITIDIHAHVLPHQRPHSKAIGAAIMRHIIELAPWAHKYVAQVPFCYPNVKNYACSFGLKEEGINRESYSKDGQIYDQWYLGATKQELEHELD